MAGLSVDILSPMLPLGIKELLTNVEETHVPTLVGTMHIFCEKYFLECF